MSGEDKREEGAPPIASTVPVQRRVLSTFDLLRRLGVPPAPTPGSDTSRPAGPEFGRFVLRGELGRGGMGAVHEAFDPELLRHVAIKVISDPDRCEPRHVARFVAEAQITGQLDHPNIVPVHELVHTDSGDVFFVMKKVDGVTLGDAIAERNRGEADWTDYRLLRAFVQVCDAVAYAHERGGTITNLRPCPDRTTVAILPAPGPDVLEAPADLCP